MVLGLSECGKNWSITSVERMIIQTLIKLFAIKTVASKSLGFERSFKIAFELLDCSSSRFFLSVGPNAKKATSDADINAEQAIKMKIMISEMILSDTLKPAWILAGMMSELNPGILSMVKMVNHR